MAALAVTFSLCVSCACIQGISLRSEAAWSTRILCGHIVIPPGPNPKYETMDVFVRVGLIYKMFSEPNVIFSNSDESVLSNPPFSFNYMLMAASGKNSVYEG